MHIKDNTTYSRAKIAKKSRRVNTIVAHNTHTFFEIIYDKTRKKQKIDFDPSFI